MGEKKNTKHSSMWEEITFYFSYDRENFLCLYCSDCNKNKILKVEE